MKKKIGIIAVTIFTGCDSQMDYSSLTNQSDSSILTSSYSITSDPSPTPTPSSTPTPSIPNKFIYVLVAGKVCAYPIDNTTKDIIQPDYGSWCVGPTSGNFFSMLIDPSGRYLYASNSAQSKIYQYAITQDYIYQTYGSNIPVSSLTPTTFSTNTASSYMSFGTNGNLYIQNYNYSPNRLDKLALTNGMLSYVSTVAQASEIASYGMTFAHITSVSSGSDVYVIDTQTNRILHYQDGLLQSSFQVLISGTLNALALR